MITYSTLSAATPARSSAALMARPPSWAPVNPLSEPSRRPIGVRAPPTITASRIAETIPVTDRTSGGAEAVLSRIDHVGIACRNLEAKIAFYESAFGLAVASMEVNESQGVREAMLHVSDGPAGASYVQLLEPLGPDTPVGRFLERRGEGVHHVGYGVANITAALATIGASGVRLIDERPRHGSMGASIAFLHPSGVGGVLTELVEAPQT